jgi:uncharacterized membrane protein
MAIAVLSLVGLLVALYLTAHAFGLTGPLRCGIGECETVQASRWAKLGPVPVALIGLLGYVALLGLSVLGLQPSRRRSRGIGLLLLTGATAGFVFSAWLTWIEAFVIHAWCQWCVTSAILMTLILVAALPEARSRGTGA